MRTWTELWVSVVFQWVFGLIGIFLVARLMGDKWGGVMTFVLFFLLLVFANEAIKDLHERLKELGERTEEMEATLEELDRWRRIQTGEAEEGDLEI